MIHETGGQALAACCGLYCGACSMKNGQIRDTATRLQRLLAAYKYADWAPQVANIFPATQHYSEFEGVLQWLTTQDCQACGDGGGPPHCAIRICATEKGLVGCWECDEVPCENLQEMDQAAPPALANRQRIQRIGLEAWLTEQAANAAAGFSYFDQVSEIR